ncbi:MAG TPA: hypothetical protein VNO54_18210 [Streptosporangiaceae bacterium]|nr:hypothetical protein [Streptosporangiaceae bacterium]
MQTHPDSAGRAKSAVREKWKFHLTTHTSLELLQTEIVTMGLDAASTGAKLGEILESYASNLPVEARGT